MKKQLHKANGSLPLKRLFLQVTLLLMLALHCVSARAQQWETLGNETQIASAASLYTSVTVLDTVPYVVFREGTDVKVKKRNGTTAAWEQVGANIGTNLTYCRLYTNKDNQLFVTYVDAGSSNRLAVKFYNDTTATWQPLSNTTANLYVSAGNVNAMTVTGQFNSTPRSSLAFDSDNNPYIAFSEGSGAAPTVKKFDGTSWINVGAGPVATGPAVAVSLVLDEADVPWLTFINVSSISSSITSGTMALYKYEAGAWLSITPSITTAVRHTSMVLNSANNLSIAFFNIANTNRANVITYNKVANTWSGTTSLSTRDAPYISLIRDLSGNLYCSFVDQINNTPAVNAARVFKQYATATAWVELKDPTTTLRGLDELTSNLTIAIGSDTARPVAVYTKSNTAGVATPVLRRYVPPPPPAVLTTRAVTSIGTTSAVTGGNITSDGGAAVTERGIVYGPNVNPTIANTKVINTTGGSGIFTTTLTGLTPAQFYYVRAYAINAAGVSYGDNVRLNTLHATETVVTGAKQMEFLNRGVVAVRSTASKVFISWRYLGNDSTDVGFNVYRNGVLLNGTPITTSTNYEDNTTANESYTVRPVRNGVEDAASTPANVWANNQLSIPIQIPPGGTLPNDSTYTYTANDASVGDVDGDGEYEIFLKWEPTRKNDNAGGYSGKTILDCYKLNGTRLWRIDLGININAGPHFTQFMVYDLDGDGKAEMACKTADGTIDGTGVVIGNATADYRTSAGWVQSGPEYLTVFNGLTGAAMSTVAYQPARGSISDWGDSYGNRADRFVSAVAYLDGIHPSLVIGRGYYEKLVRAAYDFRNGQLTLRWIFNSEEAGNEAYRSQGNHQMTIGDVDGDGKDEISNGSSMINDDGTRLWTYRNGHGDALHMSDMDPDRPGLEMWQCLESPGSYAPYGIRYNDAKTGETLYGVTTTGDVGRALAADIDPTHRGYEMWSSSGNLYNVQDGQIGTSKPTNGSQSVNYGCWWDGDLGRELLDGTILDKWNYTTNSLNRLFTIYNAAPVSSNNDTKKNPCLMGDILGDWREEILLRRTDNTALILFTTNIPTTNRLYTLMHNPQYRTAIAWQNSAYNQPPHPSYFLGYDMAMPPQPNIYLAGQGGPLPVRLLSFTASRKENNVLVQWSATNEKGSSYYVVERSVDGRRFTALETVNDKGNTGRINQYACTDAHPVNGVNYYRLKQVDTDGKFVYSEVKMVRFAEEKQLTIYPNPATASVKLNLPGNTGNLTIKVANVEGKILYQGSGSLTAINMAINHLLPSLQPGYYPVVVTGADGVYKAQLIKQ